MTPWRLEIFDTLGSTSDACVARAEAGEAAGLAILAHSQTAGRGSRGRGWIAPPGNLNLSILLRPEVNPAEAGVFALLAGLTAAEALQGFLPPGIQTTLKWPNDIMLGRAKLGGILIDASPAANTVSWLVLGIGVNLRHAPEIPGRATTTLAAHGGEVATAAAAAAVLDRLAFWLERLASAGAAQVREAWLAHAHPIGTALAVQSARETRNGYFAGLSGAGALLLQVGNQIEAINTGEILLGWHGAEPCFS